MISFKIRRGGVCTCGCPLTRTSPVMRPWFLRPEMQSMNVVLPAPLAPAGANMPCHGVKQGTFEGRLHHASSATSTVVLSATLKQDLVPACPARRLPDATQHPASPFGGSPMSAVRTPGRNAPVMPFSSSSSRPPPPPAAYRQNRASFIPDA